MSVVYINGEFVNSKDAKISVFDTGFYYGDGIYEVALLLEGKIIDLESHLERLKYVLNEVQFNNAPTTDEVKDIISLLIKHNPDAKTGMIYIQITRGVMENRYNKLQDIPKASVVAYIHEVNVHFNIEHKSVKVKLIEDPRRFRRDIKMTSLMPMTLEKMNASKEGYDYLIFKDRESKAITEGASSNIFIVNSQNEILTHKIGNKILSGCVRKKTIEILKKEGFVVKEEEFFEEDLLKAKEAFLTGSIKLFVPILSVNGVNIGNGNYEIAKLCNQKYKDFIETF